MPLNALASLQLRNLEMRACLWALVLSQCLRLADQQGINGDLAPPHYQPGSHAAPASWSPPPGDEGPPPQLHPHLHALHPNGGQDDTDEGPPQLHPHAALHSDPPDLHAPIHHQQPEYNPEPATQRTVRQEPQDTCSQGSCRSQSDQDEQPGPTATIQLQMLSELGRGVGVTQAEVGVATTVMELLQDVAQREGLPANMLELRQDGQGAALHELVNLHAAQYQGRFELGLKKQPQSAPSKQQKTPHSNHSELHLQIALSPNLGRGLKRIPVETRHDKTPRDLLLELSHMEGIEIPHTEMQLGVLTKTTTSPRKLFSALNRSVSFVDQNVSNGSVLVLGLSETKHYDTIDDKEVNRGGNARQMEELNVLVDENMGLKHKSILLSVDKTTSFGGVKQSGQGREIGRYGLEEFFEIKHSIFF